MTVLKNFVEKIGLKATEIELLTAEKQPEDFDIDVIVNAFLTTKAELAIGDAKKTIIEEYEKEEGPKRYAATVKSFLGFIKKKGNFTKEQMEAFKPTDKPDALIDPKLALEGLMKKLEGELAGEKDKTTEEWRQKVIDAQSESQGWAEKYASLEEQTAGKINEAEATAMQRIEQHEVDSMLTKKYNDSKVIEWDDPSKINLYSRVVTEELRKLYSIKPDAKIFNKEDGTKAKSLDGKNQYDIVDEAIRAIADRENIIKRANGNAGGGQDKPKTGTTIIQGKEIDSTGANFLKETMGV